MRRRAPLRRTPELDTAHSLHTGWAPRPTKHRQTRRRARPGSSSTTQDHATTRSTCTARCTDRSHTVPVQLQVFCECSSEHQQRDWRHHKYRSQASAPHARRRKLPSTTSHQYLISLAGLWRWRMVGGWWAPRCSSTWMVWKGGRGGRGHDEDA